MRFGVLEGLALDRARVLCRHRDDAFRILVDFYKSHVVVAGNWGLIPRLLRGRTRTATRTFEVVPTRGSWMALPSGERPSGVDGRDVAIIVRRS